MTRTIEVEINDAGEIHPISSNVKLRPGKAVLSWPVNDEHYPALMSEKALEDWVSPEENEAWAYLQREKYFFWTTRSLTSVEVNCDQAHTGSCCAW